MSKRSRLFTFLVGVALGTACTDGGRTVDFPMPDSTKVNELTVEDMQQICLQALSELHDAKIDLNCLLDALDAQHSEGASCDDTHRSCLASKADDLSEFEQSCDLIGDYSLDGLQACDVTTGDYERCINAALAVLDDYMGNIGCSTTPAQLEYAGRPELPIECAVLEAKCPPLSLDAGE